MRTLHEVVFSPVAHRPDSHGLRCEFRRFVNAGIVRADRYDEFVRWVDANGGLALAVRQVNLRAPLPL